jgi:hypothetical protein
MVDHHNSRETSLSPERLSDIQKLLCYLFFGGSASVLTSILCNDIRIGTLLIHSVLHLEQKTNKISKLTGDTIIAVFRKLPAMCTSIHILGPEEN